MSASLIASMSLVYAVELKLPHLLENVVEKVLQLTECELVSVRCGVWDGGGRESLSSFNTLSISLSYSGAVSRAL